jgi:hypothetical protein
VQEAAGLSKTFVLVIENAAFASGHARYQDGPDICYQKLLAALAQAEPAADRIALSEEDLFTYRHAHAPKAPRRRAPKPAADTIESDLPRTWPRS